MTASTITKASTVKTGDRITEVDTPEGPFYDVVKVNPKSLVIDAGDGLTMRMPVRSTDAVRIAR